MKRLNIIITKTQKGKIIMKKNKEQKQECRRMWKN